MITRLCVCALHQIACWQGNDLLSLWLGLWWPSVLTFQWVNESLCTCSCLWNTLHFFVVLNRTISGVVRRQLSGNWSFSAPGITLMLWGSQSLDAFLNTTVTDCFVGSQAPIMNTIPTAWDSGGWKSKVDVLTPSVSGESALLDSYVAPCLSVLTWRTDWALWCLFL